MGLEQKEASTVSGVNICLVVYLEYCIDRRYTVLFY